MFDNKNATEGIRIDGLYILTDPMGNFIVSERIRDIEGYHIRLWNKDQITPYEPLYNRFIENCGYAYVTAYAHYKGGPKVEVLERWLTDHGFTKADETSPVCEQEYNWIRRGPACEDSDD